MAPAAHYDVIVVGLGALGSATVHHLQRRGASVLGLDTFPAGHAFGSSHGHHRMIRRSAATPELDAMAARAYELWRELEAECGQDLLRITGEIALMDRSQNTALDAIGVGGVADSHREVLDEAALRDRFPGFRVEADMAITYEAAAGFLRPEEAMAAQLAFAVRGGAVIRRPESVLSWRSDGDGVAVTTSVGVYRAAQLVITAGPWTGELLSDVALPLDVRRIVNVYFRPERADLWDVDHGAPNFLLGLGGHGYYGFPSVDGLGVKIGRHDGEATTARTIRRTVDAAEIDHLRGVLDRYLPGAAGPVAETVTCLYTMTPDENYIVDRHPQHDQVLIGGGCSGTSFKYSAVLGEMLAELALEGTTTLDRGHIALSRFA